MTNDGWGSKWPSGAGWFDKPTPVAEKDIAKANEIDAEITWNKILSSDKATVTKIAELKQQGSNLVDDQAYLYFQCESCGEILDPHTKSFKILQDKRAEAGWFVKWNIDGMGYKVYCKKCGEKR